MAPRPAVEVMDAYAGDNSAGYRIINACDLLNEMKLDISNNDNIEEEYPSKTTKHIMNALVSHGCLVVDLTNGGKDMEAAKTMADMWKVVEKFFDRVQTDPDYAKDLPPL